MRWITRDKSFYQSLFKLAIPVALQNLITFSVNFADNIMISSLGDAAGMARMISEIPYFSAAATI